MEQPIHFLLKRMINTDIDDVLHIQENDIVYHYVHDTSFDDRFQLFVIPTEIAGRCLNECIKKCTL